MSNIHRIIWIDEQIKKKRYPSRKDIARKFEISVRQAARDLEYMKYSLGAPIEYSPVRKGYYYRENSFTLPSHYITEKEQQLLQYLAYHYSCCGEGQAMELARLFQRLTMNKRSKTPEHKNIPVFDLKPSEKKAFFPLKEAIEKRKKVRIKYINSRFQVSSRVLCPYKIFYKNRFNYVAGFCELRKEIRFFRLDRIQELKLTDDCFEIVSYYDEKKLIDDFSVFKKPFLAIIKFLDNPDFNKTKYRLCNFEDGKYTFKFYNSEDFLSFLLGFSNDFQILAPKWLKVKLIKRINKLLQNNQ